MKYTMRFALWLALALTAATHAAVLSTNPIPSLLTELNTRVTTLERFISSYADDADIPAIQSASNALIITIDRGMRDISSGPGLSTTETDALATQLHTLSASLQGTMRAVVDKTPLFATSTATGCSSPARALSKALQNQHAVWDKLFTLIISKIPETASGVVTSLASDNLAMTQEALDALGEIPDSTASCQSELVAPEPPARIELRSYNSGNGNSSSSGNSTATTPTSPSGQTTVPATPAFTGAAVAVRVDALGIGMGMVGLGVFAAGIMDIL
ncbi:hypothetical protein BJX64DRAFT_258628 [Aspergillus heterothallicus]